MCGPQITVKRAYWSQHTYLCCHREQTWDVPPEAVNSEMKQKYLCQGLFYTAGQVVFIYTQQVAKTCSNTLITHSSPSRLVQISDCPRHSCQSNSNQTWPKKFQPGIPTLPPIKVHNTNIQGFSVTSIKQIHPKTRNSTNPKTTKFSVFLVLKQNRLTQTLQNYLKHLY